MESADQLIGHNTEREYLQVSVVRENRTLRFTRRVVESLTAMSVRHRSTLQAKVREIEIGYELDLSGKKP